MVRLLEAYDVVDPSENASTGDRDDNRDRCTYRGLLDLFANVSGRVVVRHGPAHAEEAEEDREAGRVPSRLVDCLCENVGSLYGSKCERAGRLREAGRPAEW